MNEKKTFFQVRPIEPVLDELFTFISPFDQAEEISTQVTLGRVVAQTPVSTIDLPEFDRSAMDGFAVKAQDTFGVSDSLPAYLTIAGHVRMGQIPDFELQARTAAVIHTGGSIPKGADAVVMIERTQRISDEEIEVLTPVAPGENVIRRGEDVRQGNVIVASGRRLRSQDIGALLAAGINTVQVVTKPKVAILSSGDELIEAHRQPELGQIRDINAHTLAALVTQAGGISKHYGIAKDTMESIQSLARSGFEECDMLIISAGSSVSTRDLTSDAISQLGQPGIIQHGIAVKPGKPTIIAACDGKPVIGLPGNPASAFLVARQIVVPTIRHLLGEKTPILPGVIATLTTNISSVAGRLDSVPVKLTQTDTGYLAEPIFGKSNLIFTLLEADGIITVPLHTGGYKAGASLFVELLQ